MNYVFTLLPNVLEFIVMTVQVYYHLQNEVL